MEVLAELTRWGEAGYDVALRYGDTLWDEQHATGWTCSVKIRSIGSFDVGSYDRGAHAFHATDPTEAARTALQLAEQRYSIKKDITQINPIISHIRKLQQGLDSHRTEAE